MQLRPYQIEAVDKVYEYLATEKGNPLVVLPTGTGKSLVAAELVRRTVSGWPHTKVVVATFVRELVAQNYSKLIHVWPDAPAGVHSAGLNRRDLHQRILFAGIQSIYKKAVHLQRIDLLLVDEAHVIPRRGNGMWKTFIGELLQINPHMRVVGLSATPYRMDSGSLHEGDDALFHGIAYEAKIMDMIQQGYLAEVVPKFMETQLDVSSVHQRGGEFIESELQRAVNIDRITLSAVDEMIAYGAARKSWLVFCAGVAHAEAVAAALVSRGISAAVVTGETPTVERDRILNAYKAGQLRCVVNNAVLLTGFDAPATDLIAVLRPTKSAGLWTQLLGRGMRPALGKTDCLVLDFAKNGDRFGPLDQMRAPGAKGEAGGEAPMRECSACHAYCYAGARRCPDCGTEFPPPELDIQAKASNAALLSHQVRPEWHDVTEVRYSRHEKIGKPPSMLVDYRCGLTRYREWVCFEHEGLARQKAVAWWNRRADNRPIPRTVAEALEHANDNVLLAPKRLSVRKNGKFDEVVGAEF